MGKGDLNTDPDDPNSTLTSVDKEKANIPAEYFSSVFTKEHSGEIPKIADRVITIAMGELNITQDTIWTLLNKLNTSKSPGPDRMHPRVLSERAEHLSLPLSIILKNSLQTSSIPKDWKEGQIPAIFKKGNKTADRSAWQAWYVNASKK